MKQDNEFISKTDIFGSKIILKECLSNETMMQISQYGLLWHYKKGQTILESGDYIHNLFCIVKGAVIYELVDIDGAKKIVTYTKGFLSEESFFNKQPILYYAKASEDTDIYTLDKNAFDRIIMIKDFRDLLFQSLGEKCRILGWQVNELTFSSARARVCRLLCCNAVAEENASGTCVKITHQNIAFITGVHRVTVSNILLQLQEEGIIKKERNGYAISNWSAIFDEGFHGTVF